MKAAGKWELNRAFFHLLASLVCISLLQDPENKLTYCIKPKPNKILFYKDWFFRAHLTSI